MADLTLEEIDALLTQAAAPGPTTPQVDDALASAPTPAPQVPDISAVEIDRALLDNGVPAPRPHIDLSVPGPRGRAEIYRLSGLSLPHNPNDARLQTFQRAHTKSFFALPHLSRILEPHLKNETRLRQVSERVLGAAELLFQIQDTPASPRELQDARNAAAADWLSAAHVEAIPQASRGGVAPPEERPLPPPTLPPGFTEAEFHDMIARWVGTESGKSPSDATFLSSFSPAQKAAWQTIRGPQFAAFLDQYTPTYVSQRRLEMLTGQPTPRRQHQVTVSGHSVSSTVGSNQLDISAVASLDPELDSMLTIERDAQAAEAEGIRGASQFKQGLRDPLAPLQQWIATNVGTRTPEEARQLYPHDLTAPFIPGSVALSAYDARATAILTPVQVAGAAIGLPIMALGATAAAGIDATNRLLGGTGSLSDRIAETTMGAFARTMALFSDAGDVDRRVFRYLQQRLPPGSEEERQEALKTLVPAGEALSKSLKSSYVLREMPRLAEFMGESIGVMGQDGVDFAAGILGTGTGLGVLAKVTGAIPKTGARFITGGSRLRRSDFLGRLGLTERAVKFDTSAPQAEFARAGLATRLNAAVSRMSSEADARPVLGRMLDVLREEQRGIDPVDYGVAIERLESLERTSRALGNVPLRPEVRTALLDTVPSLIDIGPTETLFVETGRAVRISGDESARVSAKLARGLERFVRTGEGKPPPLTRAFMTERELNSLALDVHQLHVNNQRAVGDRDRIVHLLQTAHDQIRNADAGYADTLGRLQIYRPELISHAQRSADAYLEVPAVGPQTPTFGPQTPTNEAALSLAREAHARMFSAQRTYGAGPKPTKAEVTAFGNEIRAAEAEGRLPRIPNSVYETLRDRALRDQLRAAATPAKPTPELTGRAAAEAELRSEIANATAQNRIPRISARVRKAFPSLADEMKGFTDKLDAVDTDLKNTAKLRQEAAESLAEVGVAYADINQPIEPGRTVKLNPNVQKLLETHFGTTSQLIDNRGYLTLRPELGHTVKTSLDALNEITGNLAADVKADLDVNTKAFAKLGAYDFAVLFQGGHRGDVIHTFNKLRRDAAAMEQLQLHHARRLGALLDVPLEEGLQMLRAMSNGEAVDPKFAVPLRTWRESLLRDAYDSGLMDADTVRRYMDNPRYYHGFWDAKDAARLDSSIRRSLPPRWTRLAVSEKYRLHKIPEEEGFFVVWEQAGDREPGMRHFNTEDEARAWLDTASGLDPAVHAVDIVKGMTFDHKVMAGMVGDPALSIMDLGREMARDNSRAMLAKNIARSPLTKTEAALATDGYTIGATKGIVTATKGGSDKLYIKVTGDHVPHLKGKFVHQDVIDFLRLHDTGWEYWHQLSKDLGLKTTIGDIWHNPIRSRLRGFISKVLGDPAKPASRIDKLIATAGGALALQRVALSLGAWIRQWPSNLLTSTRAAGIEILNPLTWPHYSKYMAEATEAFTKEFVTLKGAMDPDLLDLLENDNLIPTSRPKFYRDFKKRLDHYNKDVDAIRVRLDNADRVYEEALAKGDTDTAKAAELEMLRLESTLSGIAPKHLGNIVADSTNLFEAEAFQNFGRFGNMLRRFDERAWEIFSAPDNISKLAAYKYLTKKMGLGKREALERIDDYFQNLHRVPDEVKHLSRSPLGSQFASYPYNQLKIGSNIWTKRPAWATFNALATMAWNRMQLSAFGQDPEDTLGAWGQINFGTRTALTDASFLSSRILFPGGTHGYDLGPAGLDVLIPSSPAARHAQALLLKGDLPMPAKLVGSALIGIGSKFTGGHIGLSIASNLTRMSDAEGHPYASFTDAFVDSFKPLAIPGTITDAISIYSQVKGSASAAFDGRRKTWGEALGKKLGVLGPNEISDERLLWAAMNTVLESSGGAARFVKEHGFQSLRQKIHASDAYLGKPGQYDWAKVEAIQAEHHKENPRPLPGTGTELEKNPAQARAALFDAASPAVPHAFSQLRLDQKLDAYRLFKTRRHEFQNPALEESLHRSLLESAAGNVSPEMGAQIRHLMDVIETDPTLTQTDRDYLRSMGARSFLRLGEIQRNRRR